MKKANWVKTQGRKTIELICPICGEKFLKALSEFKRNQKQGKRHFCSCRCSAIQVNIDHPNNQIPEAFKKNWGKDFNSDECTPFRYYLKKCKQRRWDSDLDCEYLSDLWVSQNGKCALSGLNIELKTHATTSKDLGLTTASLDRIDSTNGYLKGNVQFVCVGLNLLKGTRTDKEVLEFIEMLRS